MNNKSIYVSLIVIALLAIGGYFYPTFKGIAGAVSSSGAYNNAIGLSQITLLPTTSNGTSTSILNTGASDRAIIGTYTMCTSVGSSQVFGTGAGLLSTGWTVTAATTSVASQGLLGNVNYILNASLATTTGLSYVASTTEGVIAGYSRIWPVNTYLTFNVNATNTAACSFGATWTPL